MPAAHLLAAMAATGAALNEHVCQI